MANMVGDIKGYNRALRDVNFVDKDDKKYYRDVDEVIDEREIYDASCDWVFEKNSDRWSNNNDEAGDNADSFREGARWAIKYIKLK